MAERKSGENIANSRCPCSISSLFGQNPPPGKSREAGMFHCKFKQRGCVKESQQKSEIALGHSAIVWVVFRMQTISRFAAWFSEKLKKAVAVSEEKIQQRSRRRGRFSSSHFRCRKVPKPWQGWHFLLPENRGIIFQQRRNLPENLSSKEFRTATAFSSFLRLIDLSLLTWHLGPLTRDSPKGARAKGAWGNLDIGHTKFIPTTYQRHGVTMTVIDSNVFSASISRKKSAQPKCASCMNRIWAIALFGQARFTPARFAEDQKTHNLFSSVPDASRERRCLQTSPQHLLATRDLWRPAWATRPEIPEVRSEKLQNESFPNFSNVRPEFCPEFCSEFFPNFSRTFRASFRGRRRTEKIHQKSPPFFNAKFLGKHEKIFTKFFWRAGKGRNPWQKKR